MTEQSSPIRFGPFELDTAAFRLLRDGVAVAIEPKALDLLQLLVSRAPRVVDKTEIFSLVWKDVAVTDNALTRVVAQLRKVLEDDPRAPRYIETVATRGYRFIGVVNAVKSDAPSLALETQPRWRPTPAALAASIAMVAVVVWIAFRVAGWQTVDAWRISADGAPDPDTFAALHPEQATSGVGFDGFLTYSPDGKSFAFSSDRSGALEIYVQGVAPGSLAMPLTSNGRQNVQPAWSPDGQFIAYHERAGNGVWVIPSRGGVARKVADFGSGPMWSPDGRRIAFQSLAANEIDAARRPGALSTIYLVDSSGAQAPVAITAPGTPAGPHLSPVWFDATHVLFAAVPSPQGGLATALWTVEVTTRALRRVAANQLLSSSFALAPGRRAVYFVPNGASAIWWLPLESSAGMSMEPRPTGLQVNGSNIGHVSVSPDGRHISWTVIEWNAHVWAVGRPRDSRGPAPAAALTEGLGVRFALPVPSPDGRLAMMGSRAGSYSSLFLLEPGSAPRQLTTHPPNHGGAQWLPGAREMAFVTDHDNATGVWALDPQTGRERRLFLLSDLPTPPGESQPSTAAPASNYVFAPDFSRLVMGIVQNGRSNLWIAGLKELRPDGSLAQRTFEHDGGSYPTWSADGRSIAYQCAEGMDTHVCVVGADGGDAVQLTHEPGQSWVGGWSPDGDGVVFAALRDAVWNIAVVSRSTRAVRRLTAFTDARSYVRYPRWDGANDRVVFERSQATGRTWSVDLPQPAATH